MFFVLSTSAFALECTGLDTEACNAANDAAAAINGAFGFQRIQDGASQARFATETVYNRIVEARDSLAASGCQSGTAYGFDQVSAGRFSANGVNGGWTDGNGSTGSVSGTRSGRTFLASLSNGQDVGDAFGQWRSGRLAASTSDGITVGHVVRTSGRVGFFVATHSNCTAASPAQAMRDWYDGLIGDIDTVFFADVTNPFTTIVRIDGNDDDTASDLPPSAETVIHAIDDVGQKYLNFLDFNSGFAVEPGTSFVSGIRLYTANDAEPRDPASYVIEGTNDVLSDGVTENWTVISEGPLALPSGRNGGGSTDLSASTNFQEIWFDGGTYSSFRVVFPTVKNSVSANSMQIGEVELLGR